MKAPVLLLAALAALSAGAAAQWTWPTLPPLPQLPTLPPLPDLGDALDDFDLDCLRDMVSDPDAVEGFRRLQVRARRDGAISVCACAQCVRAQLVQEHVTRITLESGSNGLFDYDGVSLRVRPLSSTASPRTHPPRHAADTLVVLGTADGRLQRSLAALFLPGRVHHQRHRRDALCASFESTRARAHPSHARALFRCRGPSDDDGRGP